MPVLVAITIAALTGGGFLITSDPTIVAANEAKITASSTAQLKVAGGLEGLQLKLKEWHAKHPIFAHKASGTKATGTKATSTKVKVHHDASVEAQIKAGENFIASVRHFLEVHKNEIKAEALAAVEAKLQAAGDLLLEAKAKLDGGAKEDARLLAHQAMGQAKEAKGMIQADVKGDVEVKASSTVKIPKVKRGECVILLTYPPVIHCSDK